MGRSPTEVRLRRLLASNPQQANPLKQLQNIASMREQLAKLTGDTGHDDLALIPTEEVEEYTKQIDEQAETIEATAPPLDVWEALRKEGNGKEFEDVSGRRRSELEGDKMEDKDVIVSPQTLPSTLRNRRVQREQQQQGEGRLKIDDATNVLVEKHRQIQDALIAEMAMFSEQMKNNSLMMERALKDTERVLDGTEEAVEASLAATNRANFRAGKVNQSSWKTSCFTWLALFLMGVIFIFMVGVIRVTG